MVDFAGKFSNGNLSNLENTDTVQVTTFWKFCTSRAHAVLCWRQEIYQAAKRVPAKSTASERFWNRHFSTKRSLNLPLLSERHRLCNCGKKLQLEIESELSIELKGRGELYVNCQAKRSFEFAIKDAHAVREVFKPILQERKGPAAVYWICYPH